MFTKRTFWRLLAFILVNIALSLAVFWWTASRSMQELLLRAAENDLFVRAVLFDAESKDAFTSSDPAPYDAACKERGARTGTRFTLILPSGRVIGDSDRDPSEMDNHADRPEFRQALRGERGVATRLNRASLKPSLYVAVPVREGDRILGIVRASIAVDSMDDSLARFSRRIASAGMLAAALAALASLWFSRRLSAPLEEIVRRSKRLSDGDTSLLPVSDAAEVGELANAVNRVAVDLDERLRTALGQLREHELALVNIADGILMVDTEGRLSRANPAAARMLGTAEAGATVFDPLLKRLAMRTLSSDEIQEEAVVVSAGAYLEARGLPIKDSYERTTGALLVLSDRTQLKRLENVRRDFAAHASHELKTPLAAIQGFADTLLEGALKRSTDAERFVRIIAEQAARLQSLIEGLMDLARLEQSVDEAEIPRAWHHLSEIAEIAIASAQSDAQARGVSLSVECPEALTAQVNATLLERAVSNLVDNALRHTRSGGRVRVLAREDGQHVVLEVQDDGEGIDENDRERVFERFYRGPRTRGRYPEGSGLGLAIVKHIVLAHGGSIAVESVSGAGSTFRIRIPRY